MNISARFNAIGQVAIRRIAVAALSTSLGLMSCSSPELVPPPRVPSVLAETTILVAEIVDWAATDTECTDRGLELVGRENILALKTALAEAGFRVVGDLEMPYDVKIELAAETDDCLARDGSPVRPTVYGRATVDGVSLFESRAVWWNWEPQVMGVIPAPTRRGTWTDWVREFSEAPTVLSFDWTSNKRTRSGSASVPRREDDSKDEPETAATSNFKSGAPQPQAYALIVGVETYRDAPAAVGARRDAEQFEELARRTLGVSKERIRFVLDDRATRSDIEKQIAWVARSVSSRGRIYFFYAGHGAPDATDGTPFILPYDGDPSFLAETSLRLSDVLATFGNSSAESVVAFVDSCFSGGGGRNVLPQGQRPLVRIKQPTSPPRVALLSAASESQVSGPSLKGDAGLFTSYLIDAIGVGSADADGDELISLAEVSDWVRPRVERDARSANRRQTPALYVGATASASDIAIAVGID